MEGNGWMNESQFILLVRRYWINQSHISNETKESKASKKREKHMWEWSNFSEKGESGKINLLVYVSIMILEKT